MQAVAELRQKLSNANMGVNKTHKICLSNFQPKNMHTGNRLQWTWWQSAKANASN